MDEQEHALLAELRALGLDEHNHRAVALLPLVEVAWADARIQDEERKTILEVAEGHDLLGRGGAQILERWLADRPSQEVFDRGRRLFVQLAHRREGLGSDMPEASLDFVVDLCSVVAEAAGGLFGMFFQVSRDEQDAIRRVANAIDDEAQRVAGPLRGVVGHDLDGEWRDMLDELTEEALITETAPAPSSQPSTAVFRAIED